MNKDYIAKVLCINRDKPDMKCEGKCHLKSQFEKQEAQDKRIPVGYKEIAETVLFFSASSIATPPVALQYFKVNYHPYQFSVIEAFNHAIFHPPQTV